MVEDLSVIDYQTLKRNNNPQLPNSIRGCIIGKSGCGKTNLLVNLLLGEFDKKELLDYDHLFIYGKSLHQPEYKLLNTCFNLNNSKTETFNCFKNKVNPCKNLTNKNTISIEMSEDLDTIPDPTEFDTKHKNLVVFDDVMLEKQHLIESFYTRGRHNNIDCFYISQNYFKLPRQTIRENTNLFFIFKQDQRNVNLIYQDHCNDISKEDFSLLCRNSWSEKYGFVTIDNTKSVNEGKYRKGLHFYFFPK